jgi:hypothetical protein
VNMLADYLPTLPVRLAFDGKVPLPPKSITDVLKKGYFSGTS